MRHLAALAVLIVTLLAVPTAAMASTAGSGPLNGNPVAVSIACPPPLLLFHNHARVQFIRLKRLPRGKHLRIGIVCPRPPFLKGCGLRLPFSAVASASGGNVTVVFGPAQAPAGKFRCPRPPFAAGCRPRPLVFDVASGSSNLTEVSGPTLAPAEEFFYDGSIYTIMTVNPGADSFTVFHDNVLFTNSGPAITNGRGILLCSG
jgi:hypothetical protein